MSDYKYNFDYDDKELNEIIEKGMKCLDETLGDIGTTRFIAQIMQEGRESPADYTEWRREHLFKDMTLEELNKDILEYVKTHNLE